MVVVVLIAGGAAICLKLYKAAERAGGGLLETVVFSIRQQAGVMAALAATVFAVLTALQTGKAVTVPGGATGAIPSFGTNRGAPSTGSAVAVTS